VHQREPELVPQRHVGPELRDAYLVLLAEPPRDIYRLLRNIELEGHGRPAHVSPLGHGLEVVDRLPRLDLDDALDPSGRRGRLQHQVGIEGGGTDLDRHVPLVTDVDLDLVTLLPLGLEQPDDAVVLELLAHGPD